MKLRRALVLAVALSWAVNPGDNAVAAEALESDRDLNPFSVRLGIYDMNLTTEVRVDGRDGLFGTSLNLEDDLNIADHKETFNAAIRWRFHERHFIEAEHFRLKRSGARRLDGEISFGESVYPVGADLESSFTTEVTRLSYSYRIVRKRDWGLALSAGLHVTRLRAALTELAFDNVDLQTGEPEIAGVTAPLPVFGFSGARRLSKNWALLLRAQVFALEYEKVDGRIEHGAVVFEYDWRDRLGFGAGYDWFRLDITSEDRFWTGKVNMRFHGPMLFFKASF